MKRPQHMTMNELIALPIITHSELATGVRDGSLEDGGAFTDEEGFLWRTLGTEAGWVRCSACLLILVGARQPRVATSTADYAIGRAVLSKQPA